MCKDYMVFLKFLENTPKEHTTICRKNNGEEYLEYCLKYGLIVEYRKSTWGDPVYGLTSKGISLIRSKNFNDFLNEIVKEDTQ